MNRSEGERDPMTDRLQAVAELVTEASPAMTPLQRMRGWQEVVDRRDAGLRRGRALILGSALSALGVVAAGAVGLVVWKRGARTESPVATVANPIAYQVENGEIGAGGYLRAFDGGEVGLRFAEATELRLNAGARGRLTSVDDHGARFAIEQGEAHVSVTPRPDARWLIDAGPFLITVHGTVFTASWDGGTERLDIRMKHGLVSVTGPVADGMIAVRGGQRLTVNVPNREVLLRPIDDSAGAEAAAPGTGAAMEPAGALVIPPRSPSPRPAATGAVMRGHLGGTAPARSWAAALVAGDLEGILREAEQRGLQRSLADTRSEDLAALADAARYLRREDIARQALITQRARFPRSDRAHEAAYLLGRLSESGADGDVRALSWYNRYLTEAPTGAYASEALGRKMTATEKLRGPEVARDIARDYLRRFPRGTYAGVAQAMSEAP